MRIAGDAATRVWEARVHRKGEKSAQESAVCTSSNKNRLAGEDEHKWIEGNESSTAAAAAVSLNCSPPTRRR